MILVLNSVQDYLAAFMVLSSAVAAISVASQGLVESNLVALGITYALLVDVHVSLLSVC